MMPNDQWYVDVNGEIKVLDYASLANLARMGFVNGSTEVSRDGITFRQAAELLPQLVAGQPVQPTCRSEAVPIAGQAMPSPSGGMDATMECPYCAEIIRAKAKKCKHCGTDLAATISPPTGLLLDSTPAGMLGRAQAQQPSAGRPRVIFEGVGSQYQNLAGFLALFVFSVISLGLGPLALLLIPLFIAAAVNAYLGVKYRKFRVTETRIEVEWGIFLKSSGQILMVRVKDIRFQQGFFERLLGYGHVVILSSDPSTPLLVLAGIEDAHRVYREIQALTEQISMRHGVVHF
ncbi:MAG: PH domain-containing protein [Planctomycetota bacterium]|nr:PH domain-containing protein [Planctomycetota bacterium]